MIAKKHYGDVTMPTANEIQRAALLSDVRRTAQEKIFQNLYKDASESTEQLIALALEVSAACDHRIKIIPGPVKGETRAREKTAWDYGGDFYELKDVVRMTIIADNANYLQRARQALVSYCVPANKYGVIKNAETLPQQDACGYSGLNFVAKLPNGRTGEIQANTPNIMYGKMSKEKFVEFIDAQKHAEIQTRYGIECGMGHGLYEIFRSNRNGQGKKASDVSKTYYGFLRAPVPDMSKKQALQQDLAAFKQQFPDIF